MSKNNFAEFEYNGENYKLQKIKTYNNAKSKYINTKDSKIIRLKDDVLIGIYTKKSYKSETYYLTENGNDFTYAEDAQHYIIDKYNEEEQKNVIKLNKIENTNYKNLLEEDWQERRFVVIKKMFTEQNEIKYWRRFADKYDLFFMDDEEFFPKYDKYNL